MIFTDQNVQGAEHGSIEGDLRQAPGTLTAALDPQQGSIGLLAFVV